MSLDPDPHGDIDPFDPDENPDAREVDSSGGGRFSRRGVVGGVSGSSGRSTGRKEEEGGFEARREGTCRGDSSSAAVVDQGEGGGEAGVSMTISSSTDDPTADSPANALAASFVAFDAPESSCSVMTNVPTRLISSRNSANEIRAAELIAKIRLRMELVCLEMGRIERRKSGLAR